MPTKTQEWECKHRGCTHEPFTTEKGLRMHKTRVHDKKGPQKGEKPSSRATYGSGKQIQVILLEALSKHPENRMTTAELVRVLNKKGYDRPSNSLRTAISTLAGHDEAGFHQIYRGIYGLDAPTIESEPVKEETPDDIRRSRDLLLAENEYLRKRVTKLAEISMSLLMD